MADRLAEIKARHVRHGHYLNYCDCGDPWPCDAVYLLARWNEFRADIDALMAARERDYRIRLRGLLSMDTTQRTYDWHELTDAMEAAAIRKEQP